MKRAALVCIVVVPLFANPFVALTTLAADLKLPPKFAGKTEGVRGAMLNVAWSMTVDETTPDGVVRGKITYRGANCGADNADYTAKLSPDGKTLTIPMPFSGPPQCRDFVFQLTRKDGTSNFEGMYEGQNARGVPMTLKLTLDPQ